MFTNTTPPLAETYSFRDDSPYLWEEFSQTPTPGPTQSYLLEVREGQSDGVPIGFRTSSLLPTTTCFA